MRQRSFAKGEKSDLVSTSLGAGEYDQTDPVRRLARELELSLKRERSILMELAGKTRDDYEKGMLLREADHRLKDSLQLVASILQLQSMAASSPEVKAQLETAVERLQNLARIHTAIYETSNGDLIPVDIWLNQVCEIVKLNPAIGIDIELPNLHWPSQIATPLGLFVIEAISNSLKHGFGAGQGGLIHIRLAPQPSDEWRISVADDGVGKPNQLVPGFGMKLLALFARQLWGRFDLSTGVDGKGVSASAVFPTPLPPRALRARAAHAAGLPGYGHAAPG
jgi:two-component sensor histidine kinase